jgi:beta-phosphoglucomutase-like phosphatase (HAD superfamily)
VVKGFFFDMDGVLVNTYEADYLSYRDAVQEVAGRELPRDQYMGLHGLEIAAKLKQIFPDLTEAQVSSIRRSKKGHYRRHVHLTELNDVITRFIDHFPELTHVLVTTAKADNVAAVLEQHGLGQFFSIIISGDDVSRHKPDPEAYLLALKKSGLDAGEVIAFEDSASGIASAEGAGITTVRVRKFLQV